MKLRVFAVRDVKAEGFDRPFTMGSAGQAVRQFGDWCRDGQTLLGKHPEDFQLYEVGFFDDQSAELEACVPIRLVSSGSDWLTEARGDVLRAARPGKVGVA